MVPVVETETIRTVKITQAIRDGKALLASNKSQEPLTEFARDTIQNLVEAVTILSNRLSLDSSNSSIPASKELPHKKHAKRKETQSAGVKRKPGAQEGHPGTNLKKVENPDFIEKIHIDRRTIPRGFYETLEFETRQVFDIQISLVVTEYQAEIIQDQQGNQYIATFPEGVTRPAQYGNDTKASSVYLSQYQLVPLERIKDYFQDQAGIDISKGSIANFNVEASKKLDVFIKWLKKMLADSEVNHSDETSINVSGKTLWLHSLSNDKLTLFHADTKRGQEAMDRMGVLPHFKGVLCHDHWKAYFKYPCKHSLCNAHHLRELGWSIQFEGQAWAKLMQELLVEINNEKIAVGFVSEISQERFSKRYSQILLEGRLECPLAEPAQGENKKRGRVKKSQSRNLLERLETFENETLRFMYEIDVPFTNNQGERDLRMTKVQQKISGCFRSMDGADNFCRIRSYISTCMKNGINPTEALKMLFNGKFPAFVI